MTARGLTPLFPILVTVALASSGCKTDKETPAEAVVDAAGEAKPTDAAGDDEPDVSPLPAAVVAVPGEVTPPSPDTVGDGAPLDALLNLVPKGSAGFAVIRDPNALLSLAHPFAHSILSTVPDFVNDADARAEITAAAAKYTQLRAALAGPELQLDKGMVMFEMSGQSMLVYGASKPTVLTSIAAVLFGTTTSSHCADLTVAPGYVACAQDEATISAYMPGKAATELRATVSGGLPGVELERANLVAYVQTPGVPLVIETPPGILQVTFGTPELPPDAAKFTATGPATALGLLAPGAAFV